NLPYVLESLAQTLDQSERSLSTQLWQNSLAALHLKF
ncbi:MAG: TatD family deoxyribonuclease, partial [Acinetobacter sp.]|nr:TatD family deoxyribonuclease [Acinetobacter sp.]